MRIDSQFDVFVSHASKDRDVAEEMVEHLENKGIKCWVAPRDVTPGLNYGAEIIKGIERSKCLILILSEDANKSTFVMNEVERAVTKGKVIFPVRIADILPCANLELYISSNHWIEAWNGKFNQQMGHLASTISSQFDINHSEKITPQPETVHNTFKNTPSHNEESELTLKIQGILKYLGYNVATNGILDARTSSVIKKFEKSQGLDELGVADAFLLDKLMECKTNLENEKVHKTERQEEQKKALETTQPKQQQQQQQQDKNNLENLDKNDVVSTEKTTEKTSTNLGFILISVLLLLCCCDYYFEDIFLKGSYLFIPLSAIASYKYGAKAFKLLLFLSPLAFSIALSDDFSMGISLEKYLAAITVSFIFLNPNKAIDIIRKIASYRWRLTILVLFSFVAISVSFEFNWSPYLSTLFSFELVLTILCFALFFFSSPSKFSSAILLATLFFTLMSSLFMEYNNIHLEIYDESYIYNITNLYGSFGLVVIALLSNQLKKDINKPTALLKAKYAFVAFAFSSFYLCSHFLNLDLSNFFEIYTASAQGASETSSSASDFEIIEVVGNEITSRVSYIVPLLLFFIFGSTLNTWTKRSTVGSVVVLSVVNSLFKTYFFVDDYGMRLDQALVLSLIENVIFIVSCVVVIAIGQKSRNFLKVNVFAERSLTE